MQMEGMVAIVTGASQGLGRAIAEAYAREGSKVVVTARPRSPTGLPGTAEQTAHEIQEAEGEALAIPCDMGEEDQVRRMVRHVMDRYGKIDVLVNNAGIMISSEPFLDIGPERWDALWAANVRGPYLTCRHVIPVMMRQHRGSIVNIGSRAVDAHRAGGTAYNSSKAALHMFSLCLAEELREYNIAVNVLSPGAMKSEGSGAIPWARHDWHERVEPEACGPSAVFLASQSAETFTGQIKLRAEFTKTWP
jgi:NAD(P)-dependent dehydrogenase (short-subunit alcohol dehydrogenase family)